MEALSSTSLPLGFGFHPTDAELISHYLKRKVLGLKIDSDIIPEVDIYKHEPWDLPSKCNVPTRDSKWHFFTSRDRKYPNGSRSNRATEAGYWKSTGKDRCIKANSRVIGTKKTLVFHEGRPPSGKRTDWIMHEYYIDEKECKTAPHLKDVFVLCRVTKRDGWVLKVCQDEEINTSLEQQNNVAGAIACTESSSQSVNADDMEKWVNELFDPDFCGASSLDEEKIEATVDFAPLAPKLELVDSSIEQSFLDATQYLFPEDILSILQSDEADNDVLQDPTFAAASVAFSASSYFLVADADPVTLMSSMKDETDAREKHTSYNDSEFDDTNVSIDTGIQVRKRHTKRTVISNNRARLQVQLHKMETRNAESVNQTMKFLDEHGHLNLNDGPPSGHKDTSKNEAREKLTQEFSSSDSSSTFCTGARRRLSYFNDRSCIQGIMRGLFMLLRDCLSAGLNGLFVAACLVGTVALIFYFLLRDGHRLLATFSFLGS